MSVHDLFDLRALIQHIQCFHIGDQLDRNDLPVTQPVQRYVSCNGETESAHRTNVRLRSGTGYEKPRVSLLQQLINIGSIARVPIETRTENTFEFESVEEKTILYFCHARPRLTRSSLL